MIPRIHTARKQHTCDWCGEAIEVGSKYEATFIFYDRVAWNKKMHLECSEAESSMDFDEMEYEKQFKRGSTEYAQLRRLPSQRG